MFFLGIDTAVTTSRITKAAVHKETWERLITISSLWVKFVRKEPVFQAYHGEVKPLLRVTLSQI
jgi:hypothetical protein